MASVVLKGREGNFMGETPREGEGRIGTRSPSSFLARPSCFSRAQNPLSLPFGTPVTLARLSLRQWEKKWNVCSRNIEILVKPSRYFNSTFVIFLSCQCSLFQCVIGVSCWSLKQKTMSFLTVCTNFIYYVCCMS